MGYVSHSRRQQKWGTEQTSMNERTAPRVQIDQNPPTLLYYVVTVRLRRGTFTPHNNTIGPLQIKADVINV